MKPVGGSNDSHPCMMEKKTVDSVTPSGAAGIFGVTISKGYQPEIDSKRRYSTKNHACYIHLGGQTYDLVCLCNL